MCFRDRLASKQGSDQGSGKCVARTYRIDDLHPGSRQCRYMVMGVNGTEPIPTGKYDHAKCILLRQLAARSVRIPRKSEQFL